MKRYGKLHRQAAVVALAVVAMGVTAPSFAQSGATKIGYVNLVQLMQKSPQALAAGERMRSEFSEQRADLEACNSDLRDMSERMSKERSRMGDIARERLNRKIIKTRRSCQRLQEELREDFNERRNKELSALEKTVEGIIQDLAEREGYDLIVSGPALYVGERIDLTGQVLDALSKRDKSAAGRRK